ncbi:exo-alpha-sialidase [candidate division WOR-3 bacterium]|uniref:Exo-alpha-sialidase n=1 Tax=candidate division WOR-3 bacterium TaxID=2052148 RepID=A0A938BPR4_UNCW3|nr:exo-alpha-sialidase [candidate division WOR-3 bacterium]
MRSSLVFLALACWLSTALAQWEPDRKLSTTDSSAALNENMGRCLVTCADTVHVIWCDTKNNGSAIYYKRSSDQGETWGDDTRLSGSPAYSGFPTLAVSGTNVHLAFRDRRSGRYLSYYQRSTDGGRTWDEDEFISDSILFNWWPAVAAVGQNVYLALNLDTVNSEVYFRRSTDNGETWDSIQRISNAPLRSEDPCIAASDSNVHIVWNEFRHGGNGHSEVYYRRSSDQGVTWGPETRLTRDTAMSYSPTVYPHGSTVDVAWEDGRDGNFEIYHKRSTDYGETWGADERLTTDSAVSVYPSIVADGTNIHVVWFTLGSDTGIFYLHSGDGGASWDSVCTLVDDSFSVATPFVDFSGSIVHVIWRDTRDGHGAIYYKRNLTGNVGTEEDLRPQVPSHKPATFIVRGVLRLPASLITHHSSLITSDGRKVLDLTPGPNDVSRLAPGVYFLQSVRFSVKLIVQR